MPSPLLVFGGLTLASLALGGRGQSASSPVAPVVHLTVFGSAENGNELIGQSFSLGSSHRWVIWTVPAGPGPVGARARTMLEENVEATSADATRTMLEHLASRASGRVATGLEGNEVWKVEPVEGGFQWTLARTVLAQETFRGIEPTWGAAVIAARAIISSEIEQASAMAPEAAVGQYMGPRPPRGAVPLADGTARFYVFGDGNGWHWLVGSRTNPDAAAPLGQGFPLKIEAKIGAWRYLAENQPNVGPLVARPLVRHGLELARDGALRVVDPTAFGLWAGQILAAEWNRGERDPLGLVLAVLLPTFPSVNPFRTRGYLVDELGEQIIALENAPQADPGDRLARAMFGLLYDPMAHTWNGHTIRVRRVGATVSGSGGQIGGAGFIYQWSRDGGAFTGAFPSVEAALMNAHVQLAGVAMAG